MEKIFLTGKTPDGKWQVRVVIDPEKKEKRLEFKELEPAAAGAGATPEKDEFSEAEELL